MRLKNFLIVVKDIEKSKQFYRQLFGLEVILDNDGNVIMTEGLVLQEERIWKKFIGRETMAENNACELYFEESNIEEFILKLEKLYPQIIYVNTLMIHSWGQKVVRFYDLDGHLIEVATPPKDWNNKGQDTVTEIWDAYYEDGTLANIDLIRDESIPKGLYHLVSQILVRHVDGDYLLMQRDFAKPNYGGYYEATAGGSALKGEDALTCAERELLEETGLTAVSMEPLARHVSGESIFCDYLAIVNCEKDAVVLQKGETVAYKWLSEAEFREFVHSEEIIPSQKIQYEVYFKRMGYL